MSEHYRHPELGFELALPPGWRVASEVPPVLVAPGAEQRAFAPNVWVTAEALGPGENASEWFERALEQELGLLAGARVIDRWRGDAPSGARRTLVHHVTDGRPVALEQWWIAAGDRGWVVSASCAPLDYDALADDIAAIGASFAPA